MNILGISGFEDAIPFKRRRWPGLDEREYRISQGHNAAAALLVDGRVVAAVAEERLNRRKHCGDFPKGAIASCLAQVGLSIDDVDELVHSFDYAPWRSLYTADEASRALYHDVYSHDALLKLVRRDLPGFPRERIHHVPHHLAHAASAYFTSGWPECLVMVLDGMGEVHGATIYRAHDGQLDRLAVIGAQDSIGILYSLVTLHLGFDFNADEYKIMGLAPYGDPSAIAPSLMRAVQLLPNGGIRIPILRVNRTREERERRSATRRYLARCLILGSRRANDEITDEHRDVAAALQACLERVVLHLAAHYGAVTGARRLALAGGVALNCTANGLLARAGMFDEIYVQPAAGDDGSALGAALYRASRNNEIHNLRMPVPFLGPAHSAADIKTALHEFEGDLDVVEFGSLGEACEQAARLIAAGHVIAWYRGRMEFGPRALGHRSILADPAHPEMRDRINAMVKMREAFRPFAPAVTIEEVHRWFDVPPMTALPYMIATVDVRRELRSQLPATTHVDGSARVQTVSAADNAGFHQLLRAIGRVTGREMALNTSFNVKGQPIVNTPHEAITTFLNTGIEFLFLENLWVARRAHREQVGATAAATSDFGSMHYHTSTFHGEGAPL